MSTAFSRSLSLLTAALEAGTEQTVGMHLIDPIYSALEMTSLRADLGFVLCPSLFSLFSSLPLFRSMISCRALQFLFCVFFSVMTRYSLTCVPTRRCGAVEYQ